MKIREVIPCRRVSQEICEGMLWPLEIIRLCAMEFSKSCCCVVIIIDHHHHPHHYYQSHLGWCRCQWRSLWLCRPGCSSAATEVRSNHEWSVLDWISRYLASWMNEWMNVPWGQTLIHNNDEGEYMQNMFHLNLDHIVTQKRRLLHELRKRLLNKGAFVETLKKTL